MGCKLPTIRLHREFILYLCTLLTTEYLVLTLQVGQLPPLDQLLRHNPVLMWLERRGWYSGNTFPGAPFAIQRIMEIEQRQKLAKDGVDGRVDILERVRQTKRERPELITEREVFSITLSTMFAGAETT